MLNIKGAFKYYSNNFVKTYVLRDVDIDVKDGEFVTIMGPSGAGKSTLLYIMGMLETLDDGFQYRNFNENLKEEGIKNTKLYYPLDKGDRFLYKRGRLK